MDGGFRYVMIKFLTKIFVTLLETLNPFCRTKLSTVVNPVTDEHERLDFPKKIIRIKTIPRLNNFCAAEPKSSGTSLANTIVSRFEGLQKEIQADERA